MDEAEKMLLESMQGDIKAMNKNILYLCRHTTSSETRLKNIEANMIVNNEDTALCMRKISKIEGKLLVASGIIAVVVSAVVTVLV